MLLTPIPSLPNSSLFNLLREKGVNTIPFRKSRRQGVSLAEIKQREQHARANLSMAETLGWITIGAWRLQRGVQVLGKSTTFPLDTIELKRTNKIHGHPDTGKSGRRRRRSSGSSSDEGVKLEVSIEDLEERRGGSPPSSEKKSSQRQYSSSPEPQNRSESGHSRARYRPKPRRKDAALSDDGCLGEAVGNAAEEVVNFAQEVAMHSEKEEGWWMYVSMVGVVMVALGIGMMG